MDNEQKVRQFLLEAYQVSSGDLSADTNLIEAGIVDSSGILELIDFLESEFKIVISDQEIAEDHFESLATILNLIKKKEAIS